MKLHKSLACDYILPIHRSNCTRARDPNEADQKDKETWTEHIF
jgi:hypothetical protein